jgi:hypothetical protein
MARVLSNNHGLTLQGAKTELIPASEFIERFRWSEQDEVTGTIQENLHERLRSLLGQRAATQSSSGKTASDRSWLGRFAALDDGAWRHRPE